MVTVLHQQALALRLIIIAWDVKDGNRGGPYPDGHPWVVGTEQRPRVQRL